MPILKKGPQLAKKHTLATAAPFDTLATIAQKNSVKDGWQGLALYLFGTTDSDTINRALGETIGVGKIDLAHAEKTEIKAGEGHEGKIPLPEDWTDNTFEATKRYRLTIQKIKAPTAIAITNLDKWFIPGKEANDIRFTTQGDLDCAHLVDFSVYGSNYCECTDWSEGIGKYKLVEGEQLYKEEDMRQLELGNVSLQVPDPDGKQKNGWKGQVNTTKGVLAIKADGKTRYINVAFSPYTVHFRFRKTFEDKKATLLLEPFWPEFEETKAEPAVTAGFGATPATFQWTNAADQEKGVLEIHDATGQRVYLQILKDDLLKKDARTANWDKNYRKDAFNGKFEQVYIDDAAELVPLKKLLFKSAPYVAKVTTFTSKAKTDSLKIKWEIKDTAKLERGLLIVTDKDEKVVFQKPLAKGDLTAAKHEFAWDGKYLPGVKNSRAKKDDAANTVYSAIAQDMPYRVQIQAHTPENAPEALALAAMHTEVRLYVHPDTRRPDELGYDPSKPAPSLALGLAPFVPGEAPKDTDGTKWYRYQLAQAGFHPGPITADPAAKPAYDIALKEFKRSVPADGTAVAPNFTRLDLRAASILNENAAAKTALTTLRDGDRRKWFADPEKVANDDNDPDYKYPTTSSTETEKVNAVLSDQEKEVVVWVDDRQYNTSGLGAAGKAIDPDGNNYYDGEPSAADKVAAKAFGLDNYRGKMDNGDRKTDLDEEAVSRPWIPLQAELVLLSQHEDINGNAHGSKTGLNLATLPESRREAMRELVGPLRVDWTFEDLPGDVSVIDPGDYMKEFSRSRKYVAWALRTEAGTHTRKDTKRPAVYPNAKADRGGIRPDALGEYYKAAFGADKLSLAPWKAAAVSATESISTVAHDLLVAAQKKDTDFFPKLRGHAGVYFNPSSIAGDGYRVRAEVQFDEFGDYKFPNLKSLKARYPVPPQAHTAQMRIWRRSSMRGYAIWANADTGHWPSLIAGYRKHHRAAHVYFVHEGQAAERTFDISTVFTDDDYKKIISKNLEKLAGNNQLPWWSRSVAKDMTRMSRSAQNVWPWNNRDDMGWQWPSPQYTTAEFNTYMNDHVQSWTWRVFREALLIGILKSVEKQGVMRGHLFVEFLSSDNVDYEAYKCANCLQPNKFYWFLRRSDAAAGAKAGTTCPSCGGAHTLAYHGQIARNRSLPWAAVGCPLGATWLFTSSDADTWAHEVGHHRHFIHAASAPGSQQNPSGVSSAETHDRERNGTRDWDAFQITLTHDNGTKASERDWDRNCIMSYSASSYRNAARGRDSFCGKCLLRQRGWKVQTLGYPGTEVCEP